MGLALALNGIADLVHDPFGGVLHLADRLVHLAFTAQLVVVR